jgi:hypothetical protein
MLNITEQDELNADVQDFPWLDSDTTPAAGLKVQDPNPEEGEDPLMLVALTVPRSLVLREEGLELEGPVDVEAHNYRGNRLELTPEDQVRAREVFGAYWVEVDVRLCPACDEWEPASGFIENAAGIMVCHERCLPG